jgi:predicted O-linked N-acetylglucosamine transferase (SPINDLY family)
VLIQALAGLEQGTRPEDWPALGEVIGVVQPFALAYRTGDHTTVLKRYGAIACKARAVWFEQRFQNTPVQGSPIRKRLRLVIVSGQISNHSVWNVLLHGLLKHINRDIFETTLYNTSPHSTAEAERAKTLVDRYHHGLTNWVQQAIHDQPDCIFYPEIAMDRTTVQLATLRLAPLQISAWGHPITSGLPTIDLYCSGELLERPDADLDYSERLIRLPGVGACSVLPSVSAVLPDPEFLNIPSDRSITRFLICQQAAKLDPSFDIIYPRIAQAASPCMFWFVRDNRASWVSARLEQRLHDVFAAYGLNVAEYVRIIDWLPGEQFLGLLDSMDVYLDTPGFSGYTTAWQALHRGLPVITLEGRFMRQRLAAGLLRRIGITATIASNSDDYVLQAAALASDPELRVTLRDCLKKASEYTDENTDVVHAFESLILNTVKLYGPDC